MVFKVLPFHFNMTNPYQVEFLPYQILKSRKICNWYALYCTSTQKTRQNRWLLSQVKILIYVGISQDPQNFPLIFKLYMHVTDSVRGSTVLQMLHIQCDYKPGSPFLKRFSNTISSNNRKLKIVGYCLKLCWKQTYPKSLKQIN